MQARVDGLLSARLADEASPVADAFHADIDRRARREPVSHILGYREFWGRRFDVTPDVLDPRPETETLIACALDGPAPARVLDLGTGSGAILATLLAEWPNATGVATDLSDRALAVARRNLERHAPGRFQTVRADWFSGLSGRFDLIVSNPPYITEAAMEALSPEVREWEPHLALTPGGDGLAAYRAIAAGWDRHVAEGGRLLLEIGYDQGVSVPAIFSPYHSRVHRDLDGRPRVVEIGLDRR